jgi:glycosyltransferase involved in cell wall biosynthesis
MNIQKTEKQITAVIPAYNAAKYLKQVINSLLYQTKPPVKIIIVDDGSEDETYPCALEVTKSTDIPIMIHCHNQNCGVSAARNTGAKLADTEWLLFMDADDVATPEMLEMEYRKLQVLEENWGDPVVLVHSAYTQMTENGQVLGTQKFRQVFPEEILGYEFVRNQISTSGVLVNKAALLQVGGFDIRLQYAEDWDVWLKLAQIGGFGYIDEPLVYVRRHQGNASAVLPKMLNAERIVLNRYKIDFIEKAIYSRHLPWENNCADFISVLYRLEKWHKGLLCAQELIKEVPSFATGYFLVGLFFLQKREWVQAEKYLSFAVKLNPGHGAALNNLGAVWGIIGEFEQGRTCLQTALALYPEYLDAQHNLQVLHGDQAIDENVCRFTWRELRPVLLVYKE